MDHSSLAALAAKIPPNVMFGTSTWTYPGWKGIVYDEYPAKRTAADALAEYAKFPLFKTVGIDSFFYRPPDAKTLQAYSAALPQGFKCVSKVWNRITSLNYKEGQLRSDGKNADWLHPGIFTNEVLGPMQEHFADHMGPIVFELEAISKAEQEGDPFPELLDLFFEGLPRGPEYAVEVRNPEFLEHDYFHVLAKHGVAHVFNAWTRMPTIGEQLTMHDSVTSDFIVARALLVKGRKYAQAVEEFAPYDRIQDPSLELRNDLSSLAKIGGRLKIPTYVIVNNRTEGCSPLTIKAVIEAFS